MNLLGIVPYCLILVIRAGNVRLGCWIEGIIYRIDFCLHVVHAGMNCDYVVIGYLHAEQISARRCSAVDASPGDS